MVDYVKLYIRIPVRVWTILLRVEGLYQLGIRTAMDIPGRQVEKNTATK
jgi:hypothetical protein